MQIPKPQKIWQKKVSAAKNVSLKTEKDKLTI